MSVCMAIAQKNCKLAGWVATGADFWVGSHDCQNQSL